MPYLNLFLFILSTILIFTKSSGKTNDDGENKFPDRESFDQQWEKEKHSIIIPLSEISNYTNQLFNALLDHSSTSNEVLNFERMLAQIHYRSEMGNVSNELSENFRELKEKFEGVQYLFGKTLEKDRKDIEDLLSVVKNSWIHHIMKIEERVSTAIKSVVMTGICTSILFFYILFLR